MMKRISTLFFYFMQPIGVYAFYLKLYVCHVNECDFHDELCIVLQVSIAEARPPKIRQTRRPLERMNKDREICLKLHNKVSSLNL